MRDRLVSGIQNDQIREKLLNKKDLSLTKSIQLLKSTEAIQLQARDMATPETSAVQESQHTHLNSSVEDCQQGTPADPRSHAGIVAESTILKRMHVLQPRRSATTVTKMATLQNNADPQRLTTLKMTIVMRRRYILSMQSKVQPASQP